MSKVDPELEKVKRESRECQLCGGNGITTAYAPQYTGNPIAIDRDGNRFTARVSAHCRCTYGRWMRDRVDAETQAKIPTVEDILTGRSRWLLDDPTETEEFSSDREARRWLAKFRNAGEVLKKAPEVTRSTPEQIANDLRNRAATPGANGSLDPVSQPASAGASVRTSLRQRA